MNTCYWLHWDSYFPNATNLYQSLNKPLHHLKEVQRHSNTRMNFHLILNFLQKYFSPLAFHLKSVMYGKALIK